MKKKRYSEEQIVKILLEAEKQRRAIAEFCIMAPCQCVESTKVVERTILSH